MEDDMAWFYNWSLEAWDNANYGDEDDEDDDENYEDYLINRRSYW